MSRAARLVAVVPAWNEAGAIGQVVDEITAFDAAATSSSSTTRRPTRRRAVAEAHGATVLRLPFNVGIGGAVQTGFRYARDEGYEVAVRLDGDGQHDASELGKLLAPDPGRRRRTSSSARASSIRVGATGRRSRVGIGIRVFARLVSVLGGQQVTDTTSGFVALDRAGHRALRRRVPARLSGGRGDARRTSKRPAARAGAGRDARAPGGHVVDHVRPVALLHRQGHARAARREPAPLPAARGRAPMTPIRVSIVGAIASILLILVVARARPRGVGSRSATRCSGSRPASCCSCSRSGATA